MRLTSKLRPNISDLTLFPMLAQVYHASLLDKDMSDIRLTGSGYVLCNCTATHFYCGIMLVKIFVIKPVIKCAKLRVML